MFHPVPAQVRFPDLEAEIGAFWKSRKIYDQSLARRKGCERFVFYEGPPTANGLPHPGHCLTRAIKDLFPRYRTMRGYYCERKAGWDTHGLPVEVEVCKELGIHSKEEIENYGVEPFIRRCLESVFRYTRQWERLTERLGFWVNLDEAYVTYHQSFVESVWWALKTLFERGLLYQGHKIVWWWAQGGTALSSGEVGQGYRQVADPSVYVRFPLLDAQGKETNTSLLVWTTTPWTLPSNQFAAVHPDLNYAEVEDAETKHRFIVAEALVETIEQKIGRSLARGAEYPGKSLVGRRYVPPFDYYYRTLGNARGWLKDNREWTTLESPALTDYLAWRVVAADFVTTDSGTGVVHQAPAFGEVDFALFENERARFAAKQMNEENHLKLICAVAPDGKFTAEAPDYQGRWVKDCDRDITRSLRQRGLLLHQEQYLHDYPFCWRAENDPLIQYPRRSWFVRTSEYKDEMLANNARINWLPDHIKQGRFGNFLETNVDWALSRERYWGTPLPIWKCDKTGQYEAIASYAELMSKSGTQGFDAWERAKAADPSLSDHLKVHKPYIDEITYDSPFANGGVMRRVTEVIDCWFDSGAMPFAQWGYPQQGREEFHRQFPADFISEALDQTRGWFYSQLAISTLLFGERATKRSADRADGLATEAAYPHPFRNCIVLGLMLGEDGGKMSKSKRNYREPSEIFDRYGADALRWYFFANQPPWTSIRYSEQAIKDSIPEFLLRLWNVYSFFVIYAGLDGFSPAAELAQSGAKTGVDAVNASLQLSSRDLSRAKSYRVARERSELDRWILSELHQTAKSVIERMDAYDNYAACGSITALVDALSNWYVRRSRDRYWSADKRSRDKLDAYWTLYECLLTISKLIAPFAPFLAEAIWRNLAVAEFDERTIESVHLADYPDPDDTLIDEQLSTRMSIAREIVSLGRAARVNAKLKVRQPLAKVEVVLATGQHDAWLRDHQALIAEELNVKVVEFQARADQYISYTILPDLKKLGPRLGRQLLSVKSALAKADAAALLRQFEASRSVRLATDSGEVELDKDELQIRLQAKDGWAAAQGVAGVVVLSTELTPDLIAEGVARDLVHAIQGLRKERDCDYSDRIRLAIVSDDADLNNAVSQFADYISQETLAREIVAQPIPDAEPFPIELGTMKATLYLKVASE